MPLDIKTNGQTPTLDLINNGQSEPKCILDITDNGTKRKLDLTYRTNIVVTIFINIYLKT